MLAPFYLYVSGLSLGYVLEGGFVNSVCADPLLNYLNIGEGLWVWVFIYSKIPELLDTVFQVCEYMLVRAR